MEGVPTGSCSQVKHSTRSQTQSTLFPQRPVLLREEELLRLQICGPDRAVVALEHQLRAWPTLLVIEKGSTESIARGTKNRHPTGDILTAWKRKESDSCDLGVTLD